MYADIYCKRFFSLVIMIGLNIINKRNVGKIIPFYLTFRMLLHTSLPWVPEDFSRAQRIVKKEVTTKLKINGK